MSSPERSFLGTRVQFQPEKEHQGQQKKKKQKPLLLIIFSLIMFSHKAAAVFKGGAAGEEQGKLGIRSLIEELRGVFHTE